MASYPSGFNASLMPVIALAVQLGVGPAGDPPPGLTMMMLGNKQAAGDATLATPIEVFDVADAVARFGPRAELTQMTRAVRAIAPTGRLFACPVAENGSAVAATATLLFAGPATGAGVVRVRVNGRRLREIVVASGDSASTIAAAVEAALDEMTEWPCTASVSTATVTLTAAQAGPRGNNLRADVEITAAGVTVDLNGAGAAAARVKGWFGTDSATAGSGADDFTAALAAIAGERYDRIVAACDDDTNRGLVAAHVEARSGINEGRRCMAVVGDVRATVSGSGGVIEDALSHNQPRLTIAYQRKGYRTTGELAAAYVAAKIYGDGRLPGEAQYRAAKANGLSLYPAIEANDVADRPTDTQNRTLLASGVTVIGSDNVHPGYASVIRPVTTRTKNASGGVSYAVIDPSKVAVADLVADEVQAFAAQNYGDKNITTDPATIEEAPSSEYVIWPAAVREDVLAILRRMEGDGLLVNVEAQAANVTVTQASDDNTVLIVRIPVEVIPHFHSLVGAVQQVA